MFSFLIITPLLFKEYREEQIYLEFLILNINSRISLYFIICKTKPAGSTWQQSCTCSYGRLQGGYGEGATGPLHAPDRFRGGSLPP